MGTRTMGSRGNLTLDEVQHQLGDLGKPLSSMNMDELIKSVYNAESENTKLASASSSMVDLTKKTVDELWQDIKKEDTSSSDTKQPTLGEMTLEDFLAKAGILSESSQKKKSSGLVTEPVELSSQQSFKQQLAQWMQYQIQPFQQQQLFMPDQQIIDDMAYPDAQMAVSSDTQITPGRKRAASGDLREKTVERRQKRMIKNRESAARSRARKQAYTDALETKVSRLEEENKRLKREQEVEKALPCVTLSEPKYQLRRTSSTSF